MVSSTYQVRVTVTPARAVLSSDSGQPFSPKPPETLRVFAQCLHERGISEEAITQMTVRNPEYLLGVSADGGASHAYGT